MQRCVRVCPHGSCRLTHENNHGWVRSKLTPQKELLTDLQVTTASRNTIANTVCCNGLEVCIAHKLPLIQEAHGQGSAEGAAVR